MNKQLMISEAIENGELTKVLKGEDGLAISFEQMVGASAPTDWTKVLAVVYKVAESVGKELVLKDFEESINQLLLGSAEDVYIGVSVIYVQLLKEARGISPFKINKETLVKKASEAIEREKIGLKKSKAWGGQYTEEGLWTEITRYKKLMREKFSIEL